jgi:hypothetical protein
VERLSSLPRKTVIIVLVAAFAVVSLAVRLVAGSSHGHDDARPAASASGTPTTHAATKPAVTTTAAVAATVTRTPSAQPTDLAHLDHQGDGPLNCALRYRPGANGTVGWSVLAGHPGVVEISAKASNGHSYAKTWASNAREGQVAFVTSMDVPVPLTQLTELGAILASDSGATYECLVGPAA